MPDGMRADNFKKSTQEYVDRILKAKVYDVAIETPLEPAERLSRRLGNSIFIKREDSQPVFSFKLRGAYNKMASLPTEQLKMGVVTSSAGNHAQGVALAARRLGCIATIVMPVTTPSIKVSAVAALGGKVVLHGDTYDDAYKKANEISEESGCVFIHPFDDPDVIAGQGTIGMEILRQHPGSLHALFVPVGGGGLIAGVAAYVKHLRPEVRVIGVEPRDADAMCRSLAKGERVRLPFVGSFADGVAVKIVGEEPFRLCRELVDEILLVDNDDICAAIKDVFEETRSILEPAGALSIAGLKQYVEREKISGETLVAIASGANMNFDRLRFVSERAEMGEHREALFAATIPERPGSFKAFCSLLGNRGITEFNYRFSDPQEAHVFVGIGITEREEAKAVRTAFEQGGLRVIDLTDDEMAKLHVRYMVGGRASLLRNEVLYRFEFPEKPGALRTFLDNMSERWNITLFHYRNHGADTGRVLLGIQISEEDKLSWDSFRAKLGYDNWDETNNPAYHLFLV